jgi:hypothetical protein
MSDAGKLAEIYWQQKQNHENENEEIAELKFELAELNAILKDKNLRIKELESKDKIRICGTCGEMAMTSEGIKMVDRISTLEKQLKMAVSISNEAIGAFNELNQPEISRRVVDFVSKTEDILNNKEKA